MILFHAPSPYEAPSKFRNKFEFFGRGSENAKKLARRLSLSPPRSPIIIVGTAGALRVGLKPGDCFVIKELVRLNSSQIELHIPREIEHLPQARCLTVDEVISQKLVKEELHRQSQADIVDCEMYDLANELRQDVLSQCIFLRGVIDELSLELDLISNQRLDLGKLLWPTRWLSFARLVGAYWRYQSGMNDFFERAQLAMSNEHSFTKNRKN